MIGDLCLLQTTLGCLLFSSKWRQACGGWLPSTVPGPSWTSPPDCGKKWNELSSAARHIYQVFKKQSMRQTNILPMQARYSSVGTLIGKGAPVSGFWVSFSDGSCCGPSEPDGTAVKTRLLKKNPPHASDLGGAARGRKWEPFPSWTVMKWNVLVALCRSFSSVSVSRLADVFMLLESFC